MDAATTNWTRVEDGLPSDFVGKRFFVSVAPTVSNENPTAPHETGIGWLSPSRCGWRWCISGDDAQNWYVVAWAPLTEPWRG